jgi:hypothetical protein
MIKDKNKMSPIVNRILGWFISAVAVFFIVLNIVSFTTLAIFIQNIIAGIFLILMMLFLITFSYTFDDDFFIVKSCFHSSGIPIYRIVEIRYVFAGIVIFYVDAGILNKKGTVPLGFYSSRKRTKKILQKFIDFVGQRNSLCVINI